MSTIREKIEAMATEHGYSGGKTKTVNEALDALNDALAGSDQANGDTIAKTVGSMSDNVGGGGSVTIGNIGYDVVYGDFSSYTGSGELTTAISNTFSGTFATLEIGLEGQGMPLCYFDNSSGNFNAYVPSGINVCVGMPSGCSQPSDPCVYLVGADSIVATPIEVEWSSQNCSFAIPAEVDALTIEAGLQHSGPQLAISVAISGGN